MLLLLLRLLLLLLLMEMSMLDGLFFVCLFVCLLGQSTDDPADLARYAGIYKSIQAGAAGIAWLLSTQHAGVQLIGNWILFLFAAVSVVPVVIRLWGITPKHLCNRDAMQKIVFDGIDPKDYDFSAAPAAAATQQDPSALA